MVGRRRPRQDRPGGDVVGVVEIGGAAWATSGIGEDGFVVMVEMGSTESGTSGIGDDAIGEVVTSMGTTAGRGVGVPLRSRIMSARTTHWVIRWTH